MEEVKKTVRNKQKFTYSLTPAVEKEFTELSKGKCINKSAWIEEKMKEFIREHKQQ